MPFYLLAFWGLKLTQSQMDAFVRQNLTMAHWIRLSLLCRCTWTRKSQVWYGSISEQYLLLSKNKSVYCVYTRFLCMHNILVYTQDSCACTTLLCMHNTLVHALEGPATKAGTQNKTPRVRPGAAFFCWVLALVPGPSSACTRVLCMHKSVVHAQESCACTRILCMHKNLDKQAPVLGRCAASVCFHKKTRLQTNTSCLSGNAYIYVFS